MTIIKVPQFIARHFTKSVPVVEPHNDGSVNCTKVPMTPEQTKFYAEKSVTAFEIIAEAATYLEKVDIEVFVSVVAIHVPNSEGRKLVVLANPSVPPDIIREILESLGKNAEFGVQQSQAVTGLAMQKNEERHKEECEECPDRDECEAPKPVKETVH